jgi:hypothetical protein
MDTENTLKTEPYWYVYAQAPFGERGEWLGNASRKAILNCRRPIMVGEWIGDNKPTPDGWACRSPINPA